jgi:hypothetical protein
MWDVFAVGSVCAGRLSRTLRLPTNEKSLAQARHLFLNHPLN